MKWPRRAGAFANETARVRARDLAIATVVALGFCIAPTVGDVGGCGATASSLDFATYSFDRKVIDCQRCKQCGLTSNTCKIACTRDAPSNVSWPPSCKPLQHDGDVCIRSLRAASCGDYASFVDDVAPAEPTECDFCHLVTDAGPGVGEL
jgi:hypothetical protein